MTPTHSADETLEQRLQKIIQDMKYHGSACPEHGFEFITMSDGDGHPASWHDFCDQDHDGENDLIPGELYLKLKIHELLKSQRESLDARERELQAENKQHLEKLAEAVALGSTQADRFDIEIDKRDQRITALEDGLRQMIATHGETCVNYPCNSLKYAKSLLPASPSLSTKEASND